MNLDLRYYLAVFLRRSPIFLLIFAAVSAAALSIAFTLPPSYDSEARLLVESSQIPDELAAPTVNTAAIEQLQIIEQRLMTRANLLSLADRFDVFGPAPDMSPDEIVDRMRAATRITSRAGRDQATLMTVGFTAENPVTAANVVNEFVTLILRDNVALRTDRAQETLEFFQQEVDRLADEISRQSARILEFQNDNADALPDTLNFRLEQQSSLQERLTTIEADISALRDQRQRLVQLYEATGRVRGGADEDTRSPELRQLEALEEELGAALAIYSEENPRVKMLRAQVERLRGVVAGQAPAEGEEEAGAEATPPSLLDIQTEEIDNRIERLTRQREQTQTELAELKDSIARTSTNAIALAGLERDYENVQQQYNTAVDRLAKASTGERIEVLSKGQRIAVLDAATIPSEPTRPNRVKIAAMGIVAGLGLGAGMVVLLEMLNGAVRRPTDLVRHLDITPLGAVPYVRTPGEVARRRIVVALLLLLALGGLPAAIWAVHTYYLPIDLIIEKIAERIGL